MILVAKLFCTERVRRCVSIRITLIRAGVKGVVSCYEGHY